MKTIALLFILLITPSAKSHEFLLDFLIDTGMFDDYAVVAGGLSMDYDELVIEYDKAHTTNFLSRLQFQPHILPNQTQRLVKIIKKPNRCKAPSEGGGQAPLPRSCGADFHEVLPATAIRVATEENCKQYASPGQVLIPEYTGPAGFIADHDTFTISEESGADITFNCVVMISYASDY